MKEVYAGIEAGGTKFICAVGDSSGHILEKVKIPTVLPRETMSEVVKFFQGAITSEHKLLAIGIATFGPLYLDPTSPYFGYVDAEQKAGWGHFDLVGSVKQAFRNVPIGFDTDVNGAALGEGRWGAGIGFDTFAYWTIGTGIGAGFVSRGKIMHGLIHPEAGHMSVPQDKTQDPFPGVCPYHGNCLEGLASGPAMKERWHIESAMYLPNEHPAWDLEAEYLGHAMANCILNISPQRIIIGGGVMQRQELFVKVRANTQRLLNGFIKHRSITEDIDKYIVPPALGGEAGVRGALTIAEKALRGDEDVAIK